MPIQGPPPPSSNVHSLYASGSGGPTKAELLDDISKQLDLIKDCINNWDSTTPQSSIALQKLVGNVEGYSKQLRNLDPSDRWTKLQVLNLINNLLDCQKNCDLGQFSDAKANLANMYSIVQQMR